MRPVNETVLVQQLKIPSNSNLGAAKLPGELAHQSAPVLVHKINNGPAALFVQNGYMFIGHLAFVTPGP